jgi:hypothetical protein
VKKAIRRREGLWKRCSLTYIQNRLNKKSYKTTSLRISHRIHIGDKVPICKITTKETQEALAEGL